MHHAPSFSTTRRIVYTSIPRRVNPDGSIAPHEVHLSDGRIIHLAGRPAPDTDGSGSSSDEDGSGEESGSGEEEGSDDESGESEAAAPSAKRPRLYSVPSLYTRSCSICIVDFEDGDKTTMLVPCGHVFHAECVGSWERTCMLAIERGGTFTCPNCRAT